LSQRTETEVAGVLASGCSGYAAGLEGGAALVAEGLTDLLRIPLDKQVDLEQVLHQVVDEVVRQLEADRGTVYLVDHVRGELVSRVAHLPELAEIRLRMGEGVAGWVASSGERVNVPHGTTHPRFAARIDRATGYRTDTLLAAPVRDRAGTVIGVLQVLNKKTSAAFDEADEAHLEALASEVAQLLDATSLASQLHPEQRQPLSFRFNHIVGESAPMRRVFELTARAARTDATVLVRGESGSGKEAIARAVHVNSPRREGPFVKVDCAALPEGLIENELFGHEKGAFTGADRAADGKVWAAHKGTLFLDEVAELPLTVQGKLLRLVQERTFLKVGGNAPMCVDVRFVCATHRDLESLVADGKLRQDLYYRLRVVQIDLPALRDRGVADLDRLIDHFLFEFTRRHGRRELTLAQSARSRLHTHDWPGNVRELENCIESAVVLAPGPEIEAPHLNLGGESRLPPPSDMGRVPAGVELPPGLALQDRAATDAFVTDLKPLKEVEMAYILHVLEHCEGNRSAAARLLGIGRNTLLRRLKEVGQA
jgi:Nif-specific regulatory protein